MIRRSKLNLITQLVTRRKLQTFIRHKERHDISNNEELTFLSNEIKHNLHKLKCIEQKKIKTDRIVYNKILKDLLQHKHKFVADELILFLYILIYNDLYYLDVCNNFYSYFYHNYLFSYKYFNNINVNSIIHIIYSYYLYENYNFFRLNNDIFNIYTSNDNFYKNKQDQHDDKIKNKRGENYSTKNRTLNDMIENIYDSNIWNTNNIIDSIDSKQTVDTHNISNKNNEKIEKVEKIEKSGQSEKSYINKNNKYNNYYNNYAYGCFHIYNHFSPFISLNIDYINKNHLIKILLVLSQFVYNKTIVEYINKNVVETAVNAQSENVQSENVQSENV
ncbi:conserved protein, unknown function, partial [Hepatocystis sp. ex Piliocolobus tephrosceles]